MYSNRKVLYVATWGNPLEWRQVQYECENGSKASGYASIVCVKNVDRLVLIVFDSIITAQRRVSIQGVDEPAIECAKRCGLSVNREGDRIFIEPGNVGRLSEWRGKVEEYVRCFAGRQGVDDSKLDVVAIASIGRFPVGGYYWSYEGGYAELIASEILYGLWSRVRDVVNSRSGVDVEVILDVTHGINFLPTLAYHIIRYVAMLMIIRGARKVIIKLFNASPGDYKYLKVFSETIEHVDIPPGLDSPIAKILKYGVLPVLYNACADVKDEIKEVEPPLGDEKVEISTQDRVVRYKVKGVKLDQYLSNLVAREACEYATNRVEEIMKSHLKDRLPHVPRILLEIELNNLYENSKKILKIGEEKLYSDIRKKSEEEIKGIDKCDCREDVNRRHFIAHGGLLAGCTRVKRVGEKELEIHLDKEILKCLE